MEHTFEISFFICFVMHCDSPWKLMCIVLVLAYTQHRRNALQRVVQFLAESESPNDLLPSARLIFLSSCLNHTIHCSVSYAWLDTFQFACYNNYNYCEMEYYMCLYM